MSYLQGEQYYRRTEWDSAVTAYQRAIAIDSGCALAYHRIAIALGWKGTDDDSIVRATNCRPGHTTTASRRATASSCCRTRSSPR